MSIVPAIFSIRTTDDWRYAITQSQLQASSPYQVYQLLNDLVFTNGDTFYLNDGSQSSDYFFITSNHIFDGRGHTITLQSGCEPLLPSKYESQSIQLLFQASGTSLYYTDSIEKYAIIQNLNIMVSVGVRVGGSDGKGCLLVGTINGDDPYSDPYAVCIQNIIVNFNGILVNQNSLLLGGSYPQFVRVNSIFLNVSSFATFESTTLSVEWNIGCQQLRKAVVTNCACIVNRSLPSQSSCCFLRITEFVTIDSVYFILPFQFQSLSSIFIDTVSYNTWLKRIYVYTGSYSYVSNQGPLIQTLLSDTYLFLDTVVTNFDTTLWVGTQEASSTIDVVDSSNRFTQWTIDTPGGFEDTFDTNYIPYVLQSFLNDPYIPNVIVNNQSIPEFDLSKVSSIYVFLQTDIAEGSILDVPRCQIFFTNGAVSANNLSTSLESRLWIQNSDDSNTTVSTNVVTSTFSVSDDGWWTNPTSLMTNELTVDNRDFATGKIQIGIPTENFPNIPQFRFSLVTISVIFSELTEAYSQTLPPSFGYPIERRPIVVNIEKDQVVNGVSVVQLDNLQRWEGCAGGYRGTIIIAYENNEYSYDSCLFFNQNMPIGIPFTYFSPSLPAGYVIIFSTSNVINLSVAL